MSSSNPAVELGRLLTGTEAREISDRLLDGDTLTAALRAVTAGRREQVRSLLAALGFEVEDPSKVVDVLRAVQGARSVAVSIDPLWTMPGHLAQSGSLTSSITHLVDNARQSITCSTFNFQRSSGLWAALQRAAARPEVAVRVYLDAHAADAEPKSGSPTTLEVAEHLRPALVFRTKSFDGSYVRNHAKFLAIDHRFLMTTSANFSWSAEYGNVEFGVLIDDVGLAESVERAMNLAEAVLYEPISREGA